MTNEQIAAINQERLGNWANELAEAHATTVILLGVGHDHKRGELHICIPEYLENAIIAGLMRKAAAMIETQERRTT